MNTYIAIDPGKSGAIAIIDGNAPLRVEKMPGDVRTMVDLFRSTMKQENGQIRAVIEKVHSMPGDGSVQAFTFGQNFGQLQGILATLNIPVIEVTPQHWQRYIPGLPSPCKVAKGEIKTRAQKDEEKKKRKEYIWDFVQKRTAKKIFLYAADAVAIAIVAKKLWEE